MGVHIINSRAVNMEHIDGEVQLGDIEIWEALGEMMARPFHIHRFTFGCSAGMAVPLTCAIRVSGTQLWLESQSSFSCGLSSPLCMYPSCIIATSGTRTTA